MKIEDLKFEGNLLAVMEERLQSVLAVRSQVKIEGSIEDAMNRRATKFKNVSGKVVTVPLNGYISHRPSIWSACGCETSSEVFARWIEDLVKNENVGAIVIDINSPGGTAVGLTGVTDKIRSLRGTKPIIAVVNDMMASAAYFIGSAADEIVSDPDALTGCIGTICMHMDWSGYLEKEGITPTIITNGKHKGEGNPYQPLTEDAKEAMQERVNEFGQAFVDAVAKNRGVSAATVKDSFGQGRVFRPQQAKSVGMIDRIGTLENVIRDLMPQGKSKSRLRAELDTVIS